MRSRIRLDRNGENNKVVRETGATLEAVAEVAIEGELASRVMERIGVARTEGSMEVGVGPAGRVVGVIGVGSKVTEGNGVVIAEAEVDNRAMEATGARVECRAVLGIGAQAEGTEVVAIGEVVEEALAPMLRLRWSGRRSDLGKLQLMVRSSH